MTEQRPKIFLSYAHEDLAMAKRIYQDLKRYDLDIWIDCESLLPGQNWKITIEKTIKQSQFYLLLLSSHSITKRGFIQKEMKIAYEMLEQCSEDDIYLIPVRLNECEPALKISDIHYIDLFPDKEYQNGLKRILQVISPDTFLLRSKPMKLSNAGVNEMLLRYDFYDFDRNPVGKGLKHQYRLQEINEDKVVLDEATALMWQQSGSSEHIMRMDFKHAKNRITELNRDGFAGFTDWRLPTIDEAMSLMEPERKNHLSINPIFDNEQFWIYTCDSVKGVAGSQWVVDFTGGRCFESRFIEGRSYVRAVRSAQLSDAK